MKNTKQSLSSLQLEWISIEITKQLREMKAQLNKEIVEDLRAMQKDIISKIIPIIDEKIAVEVDRRTRNITTTVSVDIDKKINAANNQLAISNQSARELVRQEVGEDIYKKVIGEINEKVMPKVDNMVRWVNYKTQDTDVLVDQFRRAVEHQHRSDTNLLTDGYKDDRIITPHVRTFFSESD